MTYEQVCRDHAVQVYIAQADASMEAFVVRGKDSPHENQCPSHFHADEASIIEEKQQKNNSQRQQQKFHCFICTPSGRWSLPNRSDPMEHGSSHLDFYSGISGDILLPARTFPVGKLPQRSACHTLSAVLPQKPE